MRIANILGGLALFGIGLSACQPESPGLPDPQDETLLGLLRSSAPSGEADFFLLPRMGELDKIPQDPNNPLTPDKVALGQRLFHETALAIAPVKAFSAGTYSCASCHIAERAFGADLPQGMGDGGIGFGALRKKGQLYAATQVDVQPLRAPNLINTAFQPNVLWSGKLGAGAANAGTESRWAADTMARFNHEGFQGIETQALAGLGFHRLGIGEAISGNAEYQALFAAAFPGQPIGERQAALAIAAYVRSIVSDRAPFQRWLRGEMQAMNSSEKAGAILFFSKAQCGECHRGPALNSLSFHALGMPDLSANGAALNVPANDPAHLGRGGFTGKADDMYAFKTPQLYNLAASSHFGHGSNFGSVREVIQYKNAAQPLNPSVPANRLAPQFKPLQLTAQEIDQLTRFIEGALYDPDMQRYLPPSLPSGQCFPNNDPLSKYHLGCEL